MISSHYDPDADAFAVHFGPKDTYATSEEVASGVLLDFDADGKVIGIEVLNVRSRMAARKAKRAEDQEKRAAE